MKLEWERVTVRPEDPFRISRSTSRELTRVWVRVESNGVEGWGEADPSEYYDEDADTVVAALERLEPLLAASDDPTLLEPLHRRLALGAADAASARSAVSAALHDLAGKTLGHPLWRLWGLDPADAPLSSYTIGLDEPEVMAEKARRAREWPILKVKLGAGRDVERCRAVREAAPDATLRVDVNGGWSAAEAPEKVQALAALGVEFVEQPLPPEDRENLARLRERAPVPIVVDESCVAPEDVPGLAGLADGVNVKLDKCGGPREALRTVHTARACGLRVMLGCMLGSTLGVAPALHLASLADWVDLDGAALLASDPFQGPEVRRGRILVGTGPGLGVTRRGS